MNAGRTGTVDGAAGTDVLPGGPTMPQVSGEIAVSPAQLDAVLRDGWLFPLWVVGASHIRAVDDGWPQPGTRIHHAVGAWPVLIRDHTEALEYEPERRLVLRARSWPLGEAVVRIDIVATAGGCRVVLAERAVQGPGTMLRPVERLLIPLRNRESLSRLAALAVGRS